MSTVRLTTKLFVNAMARSVQNGGGHLTVIHHGDDDAGGLILICTEKGEISAVLERAHDLEGAMVWHPIYAQPIENKEKIEEYLVRRRAGDTDLWLVELDIAQAERFAADFIA